MTIQEFTDLVVYLGMVAGALGAIGAVIQFALVRPLRSFLRREIVGELTGIRDAVEANTKLTGDLDDKLRQHIESGIHRL